MSTVGRPSAGHCPAVEGGHGPADGGEGGGTACPPEPCAPDPPKPPDGGGGGEGCPPWPLPQLPP
eukprot:13452931-Alexandrium_andersonii.AAC.1